MERPLLLWQVGLIALLIFVTGWFGGSFSNFHAEENTNVALRENNSKYTYTNPLLLCDTSVPPQNKIDQDFKNQINSYVATQKNVGVLKRASVYFRDLNSGLWFGINENDHYSPASLLKVPTLIAFLKYAQENPHSLGQKIYYDGQFDENTLESIRPLKAITPKHSYTVQELLEYMIKYSDNNATRLLSEHIDAHYSNEVFSDLGITRPTLDGPIDFMSVKNYSYFFRVLFNASYLDRDMSEKALALLSAPDFPSGIEGGVPSTVAVAQKFGERVVYFQGNSTPVTKELHDCGVVYYPDHPYMLCIMTEGDDLDTLSSVIRGISQRVYIQVKKNNGVW